MRVRGITNAHDWVAPRETRERRIPVSNQLKIHWNSGRISLFLLLDFHLVAWLCFWLLPPLFPLAKGPAEEQQEFLFRVFNLPWMHTISQDHQIDRIDSSMNAVCLNSEWWHWEQLEPASVFLSLSHRIEIEFSTSTNATPPENTQILYNIGCLYSIEIGTTYYYLELEFLPDDPRIIDKIIISLFTVGKDLITVNNPNWTTNCTC